MKKCIFSPSIFSFFFLKIRFKNNNCIKFRSIVFELIWRCVEWRHKVRERKGLCSSSAIQKRYKIVGFDTEWQQPQSLHSASGRCYYAELLCQMILLRNGIINRNELSQWRKNCKSLSSLACNISRLLSTAYISIYSAWLYQKDALVHHRAGLAFSLWLSDSFLTSLGVKVKMFQLLRDRWRGAFQWKIDPRPKATVFTK